jgi:hypothetical protein
MAMYRVLQFNGKKTAAAAVHAAAFRETSEGFSLKVAALAHKVLRNRALGARVGPFEA